LSYTELAASQGDFVPMYGTGETKEDKTIVNNNVTEATTETESLDGSKPL